MDDFPYGGKSVFTPSSDASVTDLQRVVLQMQGVLLGMVSPDSDLRLIAHLDGTLESRLGPSGVGSGPLRTSAGRFTTGILVEGPGTNLLSNPSAEMDTVGWSSPDTSVSLSRQAVPYMENGTVSMASFRVAGTGDAGGTGIHTTVTVQPGSTYSASAYVHAPVGSSSQARLEMHFNGGTPASYPSNDTVLTPGSWTRLRIEGVVSGDNTTCDVRVVLVPQAPRYAPGSYLSTVTPTSTAPVTDSGMGISTGDVCLCAVSDHPQRPRYGWHMVTQGASGVSDTALRLDGQAVAPTFVPGTRLSRLGLSSSSVPVADNVLALNAGDLVLCDLGSGYGWHQVTANGTASSTSLRLDDSPASPRFVSGSRLTRLSPNDSAPVTDGSMALGRGDLVFARLLNDPAGPHYAWHLVTEPATGVSSSALRLDGSPAPPSFAVGSRLSRLSCSATGGAQDMSATVVTGDLAFAYPTSNPAASGYGWHMVGTGAMGVGNSALRLDHASSDEIHVDCVQFEQSPSATTYIDSYQGSGYSGVLGSATSRSTTRLSFPAPGVISASAGTVAFWMYPSWAGNDNQEHVLFDLASMDGQNRLQLLKDGANRLVLSVYDANGGLRQAVSSSPVGFSRETWHHVAFTWNNGSFQMVLDGFFLSTDVSGSGSGQLSSVAPFFYLGSDFTGFVSQGTVFDDLVVAASVLSADAIRHTSSDTGPFLGLASANRGFHQGQGTMMTPGTPDTQMGVPHGLKSPPSFVLITERGNGLVYLSASSDSNCFYVKSSTASVSFDWRAFA